jgi:hypothetical protein
MPRRSGSHPEIVTIYWRDIPAQVNGQAGRDRHQIMLSSKFQRAIDRAKRKANIYTADEDIAQWRRTSIPSAGELAEDATAQAERIESAYQREHLRRLAYAGGFEADIEDDAVDRTVLLALEELDEGEGESEP